MTFPSSPSNGTIAVVNGITYTYSSSNKAWTRVIASNLATTLNPSLFTGKVSVGLGATLIDSIPVSGSTLFKWTITATDSVNSTYTSLNFDTVNDGANVWYSQSAIIKSSTNSVATFTANIVGGSIKLYAVGDSNSVTVAFQRVTLGSSTLTGYMAAGPKGDTGPTGPAGTINGTGGNIVTTSSSVANNFTSGALQVPNGGASIGGNLFVGNVLTTGLYWASNGTLMQTGGGGGSITYTADVAPPSSGNTIGSQWYNTTTNTLYEYTFDGNSTYWVDITSPTIAAPGSNIGNLYPALSGSSFFYTNLVPASTTYTIGTSTSAVSTVYATTVQTANIIASGVYYPNGASITSNSITYTATTTQPVNPKLGDIWYNTSTDIVYEYSYDGVGFYWIDTSTPPVNAVSTGATGNISSALNGNTYISANFIPTSSNVFGLGTATNQFTKLYLSGSATIGGANIVVDSLTGAVAVIPKPTTLNPNPSAMIITPSGQVTSVVTTAGIVSTSAISNAANTVATSTTFSNVTITSSTPSISTTTGALIVTGGIGSGNNLNVAGNAIIASGIQNTVIGNIVPSAASFTTANASSLSVSGQINAGSIYGTPYSGGVINSTPIGTTNPSSGSFTDLYITGNIAYGNGVVTYGSGNVAGAPTSAYSIGYVGVPQNIQSTAYTLTISDIGKHIFLSTNANVTIPANSVTSFPIGSIIAIVTGPNAYSNILINSDSLYFAGNATGLAGSRVLTPYAIASVTKVAATTWFISGIGLS